MKINQSKRKDIKKFFRKLPKVLGKHAFLTFLGFLVLSLALGFFTFYKYGVLAKKAEPDVIQKSLRFDEKTYQMILEEWSQREKKFEEADYKTYPNPFQKAIPEQREQLPSELEED